MPPSDLPRAVFLDRDGTLMELVDYCSNPDDVKLLPGVADSLRRLKQNGFLNIILTNQSGIARGLVTETQFHAVQERLLSLIGTDLIDATYFAPDDPDNPSNRRKPGTGMVLEAAQHFHIDLTRSFLIGDNAPDIQCGQRARVKTILVPTGHLALAEKTTPDYKARDFADAVDYILAHP